MADRINHCTVEGAGRAAVATGRSALRDHLQNPRQIRRSAAYVKFDAKNLLRNLARDVLKCDCGGDLTPLGAVQDLDEVRRYLKHVNIEYDPPPRGPPGQAQGHFDFQQHYHTADIESVTYLE